MRVFLKGLGSAVMTYEAIVIPIDLFSKTALGICETKYYVNIDFRELFSPIGR